MIRRIIIILIFLHLLLIGLWYINIWRPGYSWNLASWLQLPVARIADVTLTADDYRLDLGSLSQNHEVDNYSKEQKKQMLWDKLRTQYLINSLAAQYHVQVTPQARQQLSERAQQQFNASSTSGQMLGYSFNDFINSVLVPWYREQLVRRQIIASVPNPQQRALQAVVETIRNYPEQLNSQTQALAEAYGIPPQPLERVASESQLVGPYTIIRQLPVNSISDVISDTDGYHAFLVKNILNDQGIRTFQLQELYLPTAIDQEWLNRLITQVRISTYALNLP
ncbi:MAG: hypothetical protein V1846_01910 [Candidatus Komeilibacteria bacterium]